MVKTAGVKPEMIKHTGPAVIFDSEVEAYEGIVNGKVKAGDVVVIRYEGPRGGPGMVEMLAPTTAIKGMKLDDSVALITDGRFSGGTAGACIGHISPEAAAGGPIALLEPGDIIEIDIPGRKLNVRLSEAELAQRARTGTPFAADHRRIFGEIRLDGHQRRHGRGVEMESVSPACRAGQEYSDPSESIPNRPARQAGPTIMNESTTNYSRVEQTALAASPFQRSMSRRSGFPSLR